MRGVVGEEQVIGEIGRVDGPYYPLMLGMADALLEIVGQPWPASEHHRNRGRQCPHCPCWDDEREHEAGCPWLIAARALGIA